MSPAGTPAAQVVWLRGCWVFTPPLARPPAHTCAYESLPPWPRQQNAGAGKTRSAQGEQVGRWGEAKRRLPATGEQSGGHRKETEARRSGAGICSRTTESGLGLCVLSDGRSFHSIRSPPQRGRQSQWPPQLSGQLRRADDRTRLNIQADKRR